MKKTKNPETGVVHWTTRKKWKDLFFINLCGMRTGLIWTKADREEVTCRKCLSMRRN